jgi:hypothetical protein
MVKKVYQNYIQLAIPKRRNSGPEIAEIPPEFFDFFSRNIPPEFAKRRNVHENP